MSESIAASEDTTPKPSLYDRLGGRPGLEALLLDFYQQAQQDPVIGPVFQKHVHDWPSHIATVTDFWSTQTGGPLLYRGGMGRHMRLGLEAQHFERWLSLWQRVTRQRFDADSAEQLVAIARLVAGRLIEMAAGMHGVRISGRPG